MHTDPLRTLQLVEGSETFQNIYDDVHLYFHRQTQTDSDRLHRKKLENVELIDNFAIEKYVFLKNGEEINLTGEK